MWSSENELSALEMGLRALIVFVIALILVRISGRRSFGLHSTFDNVIAFLLGAILSRTVVGASPFFPTIFACFVLVILHRIFAWLAVFSPSFENVVKGTKIPLYWKGAFNQVNMARSLVSEEDIREVMRTNLNCNSLENVKEVFMERNGKISVIKFK